MIAFIEGKLVQKDPGMAVIAAGGVGYELKISLHTFSQLSDNEHCKLFTYMAIREDAHTLFGFTTLSEKKLFMLLISVNGIGPNTAITMLSYMNPMELEAAIGREDFRSIQNIKGIGAKTAQRVVLELKDKIQPETGTFSGVQNSVVKQNTIAIEALSALVILGIPRSAAQQSIDRVMKETGGDLKLEELIKKALKTP